ncbi:hypothetical protein GH733_007971, partial [Mirounga leonina]
MAHTLTCKEMSGPTRPVVEQPSVVTVVEEDSPPSKPVLSTSADDTSGVQTTAGPRQGRARRDPPVSPRPDSRQRAGRERRAAWAQPSALPGILREQRLQEPAEALGTGAQVNNLKQYGTSVFKESPLKKQSLYLTVDPPAKDRPQSPASVRPETSSAHHAVAPSSRTFPEAKLVEFGSVKASDVPVPGSLLPPMVTHCGRAAVQPEDLDTAVEATQKEYLLMKSKCEELRLKNLKMGDNTDGFEGILYQRIETEGICQSRNPE